MAAKWSSVNQVELLRPAEARTALLERVDLGDFAVCIDKQSPLVGGFLEGTVRFPLTWNAGRTTGDGFVELVPLSVVTTQLEITLFKPAGIGGLIWNFEKLHDAAIRVGLAIRNEFEVRPEVSAATEPATRRKVRIGRPIPAGDS